MSNTEKATEFLQKFSEWIQDANLFSYIFKWISSNWIKGLYKLASGVEDILDQVFKVFSFLDNGTIGKIYTSMRVVSLTVLIIMIIVIAYKYILNERVDLKAGLFRAVLFVCLGVQLPGVITSSAEFEQKVYGETKNLDTTEKSTLSYSIVKENLADLQYASKNGFSRLNSETGTPKNNLSEQAFKMTDLTEVITPDKGAYGQGIDGSEMLFMNPRFTQAEQVPTMIHELAHAKLHSKASNSNYSSSVKEFQAELAAYIVAHHYGIDTKEESIPYIAAWTKNGQTVEDKLAQMEEVKVFSRQMIEQIDTQLMIHQELEQKEQEKAPTVEKQKMTESQKTYKTFSEQIAFAKTVSILDIALKNGIDLIQDSKKQYRLADNHSLVITADKNLFIENNGNFGGGPIDFVQKVVGIEDFKSAVHHITDSEYEISDVAPSEQREFTYNKENERDFVRAKKYLIDDRCIDEEIVSVLHNKGLLQQDKRNNVLLLWNDHGKIAGCSEKGTIPDSTWKKIQTGSDSKIGFNVRNGEPKKLKFFEAGVDLMSYMSLNKSNLKDTWFVSMEGLKPETVYHYLEEAQQGLYEAKLLSYPRTDTPFITDSEFQYLKANYDSYASFLSIDEPMAQDQPRKRYVDGSKVKEHYAIIPTKQVASESAFNKLDDLQKKIYLLVMKTTIAMFLPDYTYEETVIETMVSTLCFKATGKVPKVEGWKILFKADTNKENEESQTLPVVMIGEAIQAEVKSVQKETQPPKPFTEGTLLTAMKTANKTVDDEQAIKILQEVEGIGTEATRASIIETMKQKEYIKVEKNKLIVTEKGKLLCQAVESQHLLTSAEMTAKWETYLKKIGKKEGNQETFIANIKKFIVHLIEHVPDDVQQLNFHTYQAEVKKEADKQTIGKCPKCGGNVVLKKSFYGCSNYPNCTFTLSDQFRKKKLTKTNLKDLLVGKETEVSGIKKADKTTYNAKIKLSDTGQITFVSFVNTPKKAKKVGNKA